MAVKLLPNGAGGDALIAALRGGVNGGASPNLTAAARRAFRRTSLIPCFRWIFCALRFVDTVQGRH